MKKWGTLVLLAAFIPALLPAQVRIDKKRIGGWRDRAREILTLAQASIRCDVHPKDAQVYVDGNLVGTVRDYNGGNERLYVFPGEHSLEFRAPGYENYSTPIKVLPEQDMRVRVRMTKTVK